MPFLLYPCIVTTNHCSIVLSSSECKRFEVDWTKRKIENATEMKTPILHGTEIQIRCVNGYEKLSGPDTVTCLHNTSFTGLDDILCRVSGKYNCIITRAIFCNKC